MFSTKKILLLLFCTIHLSWAKVFYDIQQEDPCINKCKKAPLSLINKDNDPDGKSVTSCCQRGCRFFNIVDLRRELHNNLSNSLDACISSCTEAYIVLQDLIACRIGCAFTPSHHVSELTSLFSIALNMNDGIQPNILLMPSDILENDIFNDPGLGKEILPGWWSSDGFKLPETFFKTVPLDSETVDYSVSAEYLGEIEKSASIPGSNWLQCASRHTGIPRWLLALGIAVVALSALWLCLAPEKSTKSVENIIITKPNSPSKVTIFVPDEAPLYKKPPPKYSDVHMNNPTV